jgi:hypothetical protein
MVIACLVLISLNGHLEPRLMSGTLKSTIEDTFLVDFSNATNSIEGIEGDYTNVKVHLDDCALKEYKKAKLK